VKKCRESKDKKTHYCVIDTWKPDKPREEHARPDSRTGDDAPF